MFYETATLCSYNKQFANKLLIDCPCYDVYKDEETFIEKIITQRKSYMACLCYKSNTKKRINHLSVPIIIGSRLDWCIRGEEMLKKSRILWGLIIVRGILKIYNNFSTFDSLS